jgi:hypothetical protein
MVPRKPPSRVDDGEDLVAMYYNRPAAIPMRRGVTQPHRKRNLHSRLKEPPLGGVAGIAWTCPIYLASDEFLGL